MRKINLILNFKGSFIKEIKCEDILINIPFS
jgi:hypothetical protein